MMRGQVVSLLGHEGDPAQFRPFQFPPGCWLEISSIIGERVVSLQVKSPPEPQPPCAERARRLHAVSAAYIRALERPTTEPEPGSESEKEPEPETESGVESEPEKEQTRIDALCTWLEAVESWTHASALTLAWTGAVRIEARPTFTISVRRTPGGAARLEVTVEVTADGSGAPAITTTVPTAAHTSHPTVRSVLDAFRDTGLIGLNGMAGMADIAKYEFSPDWDQPRGDDDGGLLLLSAEPSIITVTPRMLCALCNTYTLDARPAYIRVSPDGWQQYLDATNLCIDCAGSFGETERAVRLWGAQFTLWVDGKHAPLFTLEFSAPVKVKVESDAFDEGIGEPFYARAVPLESMSIWQHMAYLAGHAEDLLLRIAGAGPKQPEVPGSRKCPKLKSPLLGLLSEATIRKILAHLKRAVLPPSRRVIA